MTVIERPVVNLLTFQVWDSETAAWRDLANQATSVDIKRGGSQSGASTTMQVGTLDATLYGDLDLRFDPALKPNSPIRVVRPAKAAALVWDLLPAGTTGDAAGIMPLPVTIHPTDGSIDIEAGRGTLYLDKTINSQWNSQVAATVAANTLLFATPNTGPSAAITKPNGAFVAGQGYVLRCTLSSMEPDAVNPPVQLCIFTGDRTAPTIIAATDPITITSKATKYTLTFTPPLNDDWNIGIATVSEVTLAANNTAATWADVLITGLAVWDNGSVRPEFTGTISDIYQSVALEKTTGHRNVFTTLAAVDAIQSLANTDRYGVIADSGAGYQTWSDRIRQLADSSLVQLAYPVDPNTIVLRQSGYGTDVYTGSWYAGGAVTGGTWNGPAAGTAIFDVSRVNAASGTDPAGKLAGGYLAIEARTLHPQVGYVATFTVTVTSAVNYTPGAAWVAEYTDDTVTVTGTAATMTTAAGAQSVSVAFTPGRGVGRIGLYQTGTADTFTAADTGGLHFTIAGLTVSQVGDPRGYALQDVAYESSLLNHLDLACNSVGARWSVTKHGIVVCRRQLEQTDPVLTFTDTGDGDISYTDVSLSYDTRNVVNSLKLNQHGYDAATGDAADSSETYTQPTSVTRWGARASELDTCLYTADTHATDAARRAQEAMSGLARPTYAVDSFTFNVQSAPDVLDALELRETIRVVYGDIVQTCRVLAISHTITPTRWMVTVTVNEIQAGPTFADLTAAFTGTFADFDTAHAGQTFRAFNSDPI